jgi:hypothetical protein
MNIIAYSTNASKNVLYEWFPDLKVILVSFEDKELARKSLLTLTIEVEFEKQKKVEVHHMKGSGMKWCTAF